MFYHQAKTRTEKSHMRFWLTLGLMLNTMIIIPQEHNSNNSMIDRVVYQLVRLYATTQGLRESCADGLDRMGTYCMEFAQKKEPKSMVSSQILFADQSKVVANSTQESATQLDVVITVSDAALTEMGQEALVDSAAQASDVSDNHFMQYVEQAAQSSEEIVNQENRAINLVDTPAHMNVQATELHSDVKIAVSDNDTSAIEHVNDHASERTAGNHEDVEYDQLNNVDVSKPYGPAPKPASEITAPNRYVVAGTLAAASVVVGAAWYWYTKKSWVSATKKIVEKAKINPNVVVDDVVSLLEQWDGHTQQAEILEYIQDNVVMTPELCAVVGFYKKH